MFLLVTAIICLLLITGVAALAIRFLPIAVFGVGIIWGLWAIAEYHLFARIFIFPIMFVYNAVGITGDLLIKLSYGSAIVAVLAVAFGLYKLGGKINEIFWRREHCNRLEDMFKAEMRRALASDWISEAEADKFTTEFHALDADLKKHIVSKEVYNLRSGKWYELDQLINARVAAIVTES
jgi:hypothetical protein